MSGESRPDGGSGRVERPSAFDLTTSAAGGESVDDSLERKKARRRRRSTGPYMTKSRAAALEEAMNPRQRLVLETVARLRIVSAKQLLRLHYDDSASGQRLARADLASMNADGLISRLGRRVGGVRAGSNGFVYSLGRAGQRIAEPGRNQYHDPWTPGEMFLKHALAVSELYVGLATSRDTGTELVAFETEPRCWRTFTGPGGAPVTLKPDASLRLASEGFDDHWFVEVDCATESTPRLRRKASVYVRYWQSGREQARHQVFPRVLFVVPDERRCGQLIAALTGLEPEHWHLFAVAEQREVIEQLTRPSKADLTERR